MDITGRIKGIKYKKIIGKDLNKSSLEKFDINSASATSLIFDKQNLFAVSKWVSPKRTRSYPYERIYDSMHISKKISVIPIIKDEGKNGDRDFLQWDTISLMSLLDICVIFAYYSHANVNKSADKITDQQFDNCYVLSKIKEVEDYHSSGLHWNLKELANLNRIVDKAKNSYLKIEEETKIKLHNFNGINKFENKIAKDIKDFIEFSRAKSEKAQNREYKTIQSKESLNTLSKSKITIQNYLGGKYFFSVDEVELNKNIVNLIENKHSKNSVLPSESDVKDGLVKMILYSNLTSVKADGAPMKSVAVLRLTSDIFIGSISSESVKEAIVDSFKTNKLSEKQKIFIECLFKEANENNFVVQICGTKQ